MSLSLENVHYETNTNTVKPETPRTARRRVDAAKIRQRLFNRRSGGTVHSESSLNNRVQAQKPPLADPSSRQADTVVHSPGGGHLPPFQGDLQLPHDRFRSTLANVSRIRPVNSSVKMQESIVPPMVKSEPTDASLSGEQKGGVSTEIRLETPIGVDQTRHTLSKPTNTLMSKEPVLGISKGSEGKFNSANTSESEAWEEEYLSDERSQDSVPNAPSSTENRVESIANVLVQSTNGSLADDDAMHTPSEQTNVNVSCSEKQIPRISKGSEEHVDIAKAPIDSEAAEEEYLSDERSLDSLLLSVSMKDAVQSLVVAKGVVLGGDVKLDIDDSNSDQSSLTNSLKQDMSLNSDLHNSISSLDIDTSRAQSKTTGDLLTTSSPAVTPSPKKRDAQESRKSELTVKVKRWHARRKPDSRDDQEFRAISPNSSLLSKHRSHHDHGSPASNSSPRFSKRDRPPPHALKSNFCLNSGAQPGTNSLNSPSSLGIQKSGRTNTRPSSMDDISCESSPRHVLTSISLPKTQKSLSWCDERSGLPQQPELKSSSHSELELPSVGRAHQPLSLDTFIHETSKPVLGSSSRSTSGSQSTISRSEPSSMDSIGHEISTAVLESSNHSMPEVQSNTSLTKPSSPDHIWNEKSTPVLQSSKHSISENQSTISLSKPSSVNPVCHEVSTPVQECSSHSLNGIPSMSTFDDNRETIVSVLKSSSYPKPEVLASSFSMISKDDKSVRDIRLSNTENTAARSNVRKQTHPTGQQGSTELVVTPQSLLQHESLPSFEDIDTTDSKSDTEAELALDSFRLFEQQVDAQMREIEELRPKSPDSPVSSKLSLLDNDHESLLDSDHESSRESDNDSNSFLEPTLEDGQITSVPSDEGDFLNSFLLIEQQMDSQLVAQTTTRVVVTRDNDTAQGEIMMLQDALTRRDEALACQDALIEKQRQEIAVLKMERDLLHANLKSSRVFRSSPCDDYIFDGCGRAVCKWSDSFRAALACD
jgi:hypothetical protein